MRTSISNKSLLLAAGATFLLALGGCAYQGERGYDDGYYYDTCDGYYDDYYGPFIGGYWANDGYFYYWDRNHRYHRDDNRHFRHQRFDGGKPFHGDHGRDRDHGDRDHGDRGRGGDHDRDHEPGGH